MTMLLIIGISQAVFSLINSSQFKDFYLKINIQKAEIMTAMLKEDVDYLLCKGVKIHKLVKMENMLKEVIDVSPELQDISIYDSRNDILHLANKDDAIDFVRPQQNVKKIDQSHSEMDPDFQLKKKLIKTVEDQDAEQSIVEGTIITNISKQVLFDKIFEIRIDSATVLIISFLFMVELLIMIFRIIQSSARTDQSTSKIEFADIRPVTFIFFFSFDLCISFLPLYMEQLYVPMFGLSKDLVLSLPISGEMLFAGITTIIAGWLLDRINWHLPFIYGLVICSIGSFYSWLSPDAYHLLFSRCLTGIGYGLSFMAAQGFVVSYTDNKTKTQGLTQLFAGLMAGSICGGAAGAMIADRIGYAPIFFISGILIVVTVLYTLYFMRAGFKKKVVKKRIDDESLEKDSKGLKLIFKFIFNRNIFSLLILGILPTAFSIVGFINFFYPVYLNRLGETQSNIGRIYMIYGLCLIYIAPLLSKFVDRSDNKKLFIVITGLIGGIAFTSFYFVEGLWATMITVLLLGISSSFDASRTYALNLKITKSLGEGIAMGIFNLAEKIGQVVGPIMFGLFFITTSVNQTMAVFGIIYITITFLFMFTAQSDKKLKMQGR
ncbi:MAG: inner membrane transport protein (PmrA-like protein) [Candidatus Magnetoglobus multicellularis str. Araruama]|uniref:Inner membrane transport protein (PmrA-like protein) n=1 Tax=Candidatus Magnetoglobus multicellularis str. Araruama TaxID=890399 RepID=A0A1V1PHA1_9BACT|nr:MAG: inner membrane transport protein (PmrA-like protein) [Candidatus Magnetoglobus multicellularis str. Araruama]